MLYKTILKESLNWTTIIVWVFILRIFGIEYDYSGIPKLNIIGKVMVLSLPLALFYLIIYIKFFTRDDQKDII